MKLSDDKSLPFQQGTTSVKAKITQTLLAPKIAYRLVDGEMIKVDGNFGIRYFHLGTTLDVNLARGQPSLYQSANWVDYTGGARFVAALSPRFLVTVLGDVGAGGADLDYQVVGGLGFKLKPNMVLMGGWRYLDVNYRPKSTFVYDTATSGLIIGLTFNLK
jgi:opacity protein-like surface antigen